MHRPIAICAAAAFLFAVFSGGAAQAQRGGQQQIVVPAPAVTITPPPPTVNITTPPPTVNVTTPQPTVNVTVPGANDAGQAVFGVTPGIGSLLGALLGLLGIGLIAWLAIRSLRHHLDQQAAQTREVMHEEAALNREAELRRADSERRAIAAAFLAEVGHILRLFKAAQDSPADAAGFVAMPSPKTAIFDAYAGHLHLLNYETVYAVTQAYSTLGDLRTLRVRDPADPAQGELLRLHKQAQVGGTITLVDRAHALLKAAANIEPPPDRAGADRPAADRPAADRPHAAAAAAVAATESSRHP